MVLVVVVSLLVLTGTDCEQVRLDAMDDGFTLNEDGTTQRPCGEYAIYIDDSVRDPEFGFDTTLITDAMDYLNAQCVDRTFFHLYDEPAGTPIEIQGFLGVAVGYTGDGDDWWDGGMTHGTFDFAITESGCLSHGLIVVSSDITYDERTVRDVIKHELGHALGLAHDGGSEDLNSMMGVPLVYDGELTYQDRSLICQQDP